MPRIQETVEIHVARADVFRFCHDLKHWPEWVEQIEAVEMITPQPFRRGTLLRIDSRQGGSAVFSWEAEVVDYQMPSGTRIKAIDTAGTSPFAAGSELTWEFVSTGSGTRFSWSWNYQPRGFIANLLDKLGRQRATQKAMQASLAALKNLLESGRRATIHNS